MFFLSHTPDRFLISLFEKKKKNWEWKTHVFQCASLLESVFHSAGILRSKVRQTLAQTISGGSLEYILRRFFLAIEKPLFVWKNADERVKKQLEGSKKKRAYVTWSIWRTRRLSRFLPFCLALWIAGSYSVERSWSTHLLPGVFPVQHTKVQKVRLKNSEREREKNRFLNERRNHLSLSCLFFYFLLLVFHSRGGALWKLSQWVNSPLARLCACAYSHAVLVYRASHAVSQNCALLHCTYLLGLMLAIYTRLLQMEKKRLGYAKCARIAHGRRYSVMCADESQGVWKFPLWIYSSRVEPFESKREREDIFLAEALPHTHTHQQL